MGWTMVIALTVAAYVVWHATRSHAAEQDAPRMAAQLRGPGTYEFDIVGESNYQQALESVAGPRDEDGKQHKCEAHLVLEDENPHDDQAVRVDINGLTVGYLDRRMARQFRKEIGRIGATKHDLVAQAMIVGGWKRGNRDSGHYGVKLDLPLTG